MNNKMIAFFFLFALAMAHPHQEVWAQRPIPHALWGVTTDSISELDALADSLRSLKVTPTTRIVFDEFVPASNYRRAVERIYPVSFIMGEILDSYYMKNYTVKQYVKRVNEYVGKLGDKVDIWEIGNEINGEWLGPTSEVVQKMSKAFDIVKSKGLRTELTLYYNQDCWSNPQNEMFAWAQRHIPARMKEGLDYVLVSYYEDDCNNLAPNWEEVFQRLSKLFPNSKIGMGEVGTKFAGKKASYIKRYYNMKIDLPQYVGGYFWWYFKQDMVPKTKPLWSVLNEAIPVL